MLKPAILGVIMEHFIAGRPVLRRAAPAEGETADGRSEVVAQIKELLETRVRPAVAQDGGDITFRGSRTVSFICTCKARAQGAPVRPRP